jgi:hypothetical protein
VGAAEHRTGNIINTANIQMLLHSMNAFATPAALPAGSGMEPVGIAQTNTVRDCNTMGGTEAAVAQLEALFATAPADVVSPNRSTPVVPLHISPVIGSPPRSVAIKRLAHERTPVKGLADKLPRS